MFQDISERKLKKQVHQKEEKKCRNLFNSSPDAVGIIKEENLTVKLAIAESFGLSQK